MDVREATIKSIQFFKELGVSIGSRVLYNNRPGTVYHIDGWITAEGFGIVKYGLSPYAVVEYDEPLRVSESVFYRENVYGGLINDLKLNNK